MHIDKICNIICTYSRKHETEGSGGEGAIVAVRWCADCLVRVHSSTANKVKQKLERMHGGTRQKCLAKSTFIERVCDDGGIESLYHVALSGKSMNAHNRRVRSMILVSYDR